MQVTEPFVLIFAACWMSFFYLPMSMFSKRTRTLMSW
jgi:hypothetical protein